MKTMQYELKPKVKEFLNEDIKELYINGEYTPTVTSKTFNVLDLAKEHIESKVSETQEKDIDNGEQPAREPLDNGDLTKMPAAELSRIIYKFEDVLEENREELAQLEDIDNGKPYKIALEDDVDGTVEHFRYYAGWATKITGKTVQVSPEYL